MIELGKIVTTHGIRGEVKVQSYCDEGFFKKVRRVSVGGQTRRVLSARENRGFVLLALEGVCDMTQAETLRGESVFAEREDLDMQGRYFWFELFGAEVYDERLQKVVGTLRDMTELPSQRLLHIETPAGEALVPDVPAFVIKKSPERIIIRTTEGIYLDED